MDQTPATPQLPSLWPYITEISKRYLKIIIKSAIIAAIVFYGFNGFIAPDFKISTVLSYQSAFILTATYFFATDYLMEAISGILIRLNGIWQDTILTRSYLYYIATTLTPVKPIDKKDEVCNNSEHS